MNVNLAAATGSKVYEQQAVLTVVAVTAVDHDIFPADEQKTEAFRGQETTGIVEETVRTSLRTAVLASADCGGITRTRAIRRTSRAVTNRLGSEKTTISIRL